MAFKAERQEVAKSEQVFDTELMVAAAFAESHVERRAGLRLVAEQVTPLVLANQRMLPLLPTLSELFVGGSLQRGFTVAVNGIGATSLSLLLAAGPSQAGSWTAFVGVDGLGLAAVAEAGVALERLLVVDTVDASTNVGVIAALVGAVDVVIVGPSLRIGPSELRRLAARLRESGSVLIQIGSREASGVDIGVQVTASEWLGLGEGYGLLRSRKVEVCAQGRGAASKARTASLLLPGPDGTPRRVDTPMPTHTGLPLRSDQAMHTALSVM